MSEQTYFATRPDYSDLVQNMEPREAVGYLLDLIKGNAEDHKRLAARFLDQLHEKGLRLPPTPAILFSLLYARQNRIVLYEDLIDRFESMTGKEYTTRQAVSTGVKRIRRALDKTNWPIQIECIYGLGFRMSVPKGWSLAQADGSLR